MWVFPPQVSREALCWPLLFTVAVLLPALCLGDLCYTVPQTWVCQVGTLRVPSIKWTLKYLIVRFRTYYFWKLYLSMYWKNQKEGEGEGEKHGCEEKHWSVASHMYPDWEQKLHLGTCPHRESNQWPFVLQDEAQKLSQDTHQGSGNPFKLPSYCSPWMTSSSMEDT